MQEYVDHLDLHSQDTKWFITYVVQQIESTARTQATSEESRQEYSEIRIPEQQAWFAKILFLLGWIIGSGHEPIILQALVTLKTACHSNNSRLGHLSPQKASQRVDELIKAFTADEEVPSECRIACFDDLPDSEPLDPDSPLDHTKHECEIEFGEMSWSSPPGSRLNQSWDFASAARILRSAYLDRHPLIKCNPGNKSCYHKSSIRMLEWLQRKALSEIRTKVMLTIGHHSTRLPQELLDQILAYAIEAEQIPTNPLVKETIMVDPPEDMTSTMRARRGIDGPRPFTRTRDIYRCPNIIIEDGKPEDVFSSWPRHMLQRRREAQYESRDFW